MTAVTEPSAGVQAHSPASYTTVDQIARVCHEANRALRIANGEEPGPHWAAAPASTQNSARAGVAKALAGWSPEELHEGWAARKRSLGWKYGPVQDERKKRHPNLVPYKDLPPQQRVKDALFLAIVTTLAAQEALPDGALAENASAS